jgi:hypothetical protein
MSLHVEKPIPGLEPLDGGAGPALSLGEGEAKLLVARVLDRHGALAPKGRLLRWRRVPTLAVGIVVASTAAAAAYQRSWPNKWFAATEARAPAPAVAPPKRSRVAPAVTPVPASPPSDASLTEQRTAEAVAEEPSPSLPKVGARRHVPARASSRVAPPTSSPAVAAKPALEPAVSVPEAADRLERANTLRGERRFGPALQAYLAVVQRYPNSLQAQAARVAAASLSLEHFSDGEGAERLYSEAAARGTELSAEAAFGIAESHRARGDAERESAALRGFLRAHPQSPLVAVAERRLRELEKR